MYKLNKERMMNKIREYPFQNFIGEFRIKCDADTRYLYLYTDGITIIRKERGASKRVLSCTFNDLFLEWKVDTGNNPTFTSFLKEELRQYFPAMYRNKDRMVQIKENSNAGQFNPMCTFDEFIGLIARNLEWV